MTTSELRKQNKLSCETIKIPFRDQQKTKKRHYYNSTLHKLSLHIHVMYRYHNLSYILKKWVATYYLLGHFSSFSRGNTAWFLQSIQTTLTTCCPTDVQFFAADHTSI